MGIIEQMQEDGWPEEAIEATKKYAEDYEIVLSGDKVELIVPDDKWEETLVTIWPEPEYY